MEEFILYNKEKRLYLYAEKYIFGNVPKVHLALKIKLENSLFNIIELTIKANINRGNIRKKYINDLLCEIYLADFYIGMFRTKKIIETKRYNSFLNALGEIKKLTLGWIKSEEK